MKNVRMGKTDEAYKENTEIKNLVELGSENFENSNYFKFLEIHYILQRQFMFLDDKDAKLIGYMEDPVCSNILKNKLKEITDKHPELSDESLSKEFRCQVISFRISGLRVLFVFENTNSKEEAISVMEKGIKNISQCKVLNFMDGEKEYLLSEKHKMMKELKVEENDFITNFIEIALIRQVI